MRQRTLTYHGKVRLRVKYQAVSTQPMGASTKKGGFASLVYTQGSLISIAVAISAAMPPGHSHDPSHCPNCQRVAWNTERKPIEEMAHLFQEPRMGEEKTSLSSTPAVICVETI